MRTPYSGQGVMEPVQGCGEENGEQEESRTFLKRVNRWVGVRGTRHVGRTPSTSEPWGTAGEGRGEETQAGNRQGQSRKNRASL